MATMKALVKSEQARGLSLRRVEIPTITEDHEVLVKVKYASICGTDLHIYQWNEWAKNRINTPQISGHEFSGEVIGVGKAVKGVQIGDFISAETHIPCGYCRLCRTGNMHICRNMKILGVDTDGVFAEYAKVPEVVLWKNSPALSQHFASVQEPLGNAVFTVTTGGVAGRSVLITGAGPIGLMAIQVAKALGAGPIIVSEVKDYRLDMAAKNGADYVFNPTKEDVFRKVKDITNEEGVEVALEMSGNEKALALCIDALLPSGHISALGVFDKPFPIDINKVIFKNITLYGITGRKMFETWYIASSLLLNKRVDLNKIVTHLLPLEEWEKGFLLMEQGNCGKVVLKIGE